MTEVNTYKTALKKSNSFEILRRQWERYDGVRSAVVTPGSLHQISSDGKFTKPIIFIW
jgi:hypothetical protein